MLLRWLYWESVGSFENIHKRFRGHAELCSILSDAFLMYLCLTDRLPVALGRVFLQINTDLIPDLPIAASELLL